MNWWGFIVDGSIELSVLVDDIGYCLSIGRGSGSAAVYPIVDMCEFIGHSVGL